MIAICQTGRMFDSGLELIGLHLPGYRVSLHVRREVSASER